MKSKSFLTEELKGFVLFEPVATGRIMTIGITIEYFGAKLTYGAMEALKFPKFCNVFFDDSGKRMMLKTADEKTLNVFPIKTTDAKGKNTQLGFIKSMRLREKLIEIGNPEIIKGQKIIFDGYRPDNLREASDILIFDLSSYRKITRNGGK